MYCPSCGAYHEHLVPTCPQCHAPMPIAHGQLPPGERRALRIAVPIDRDPVAIAAGYLGLFSLIIFPAPFAIGIGIWALVRLRHRPELMGRGRAWFGIIMGVACLGFFLLFALAPAGSSSGHSP